MTENYRGKWYVGGSKIRKECEGAMGKANSKPMRKSRQATEPVASVYECKARIQASPRVKHFGLFEPEGLASQWPVLVSAKREYRPFPTCSRGHPALARGTCERWVQATEHAVKDFRRVPFFRSPFFGQARKVTKTMDKKLEFRSGDVRGWVRQY